MAAPTYMSLFLSLTGRIIRAPVVATGIGPLIYLAEKGTGSSAGDIETVLGTGAADAIDALETANKISSQAAADLLAAFSQSVAVPSVAYVVIYDPGAGTPETPADAMDYWEADGVSSFGVVALESRVDAAVSALGTWSASSGRFLRYARVCQTASSDMITSGKPAGLSDAAVLGTRMSYHDDATEPAAAAYAGSLSGFSLAASPIGSQIKVDGVALLDAATTAAQIATINANDAVCITQFDKGVQSNVRVDRGVNGYDGNDWSATTSLIYAVKLMSDALSALSAQRAALGQALKADPPTLALVRGRLNAALSPIGPAPEGSGHLVATTLNEGQPDALALPNGRNVEVTASGSAVTATVTLAIGPEIYTISLDATGVITTG